jgi:hypothetical protein
MLMDLITLDNFPKQGKEKVKEFITILKVIFMLEIGEIIHYRVMAFIYFLTDKSMKEVYKKG